MHVMVIGAAGMIGRKLVEKLGSDAEVLGFDIDKLTLVDVIEPPVPAALASVADALALDLSEPKRRSELAAMRPDVIFHLAAIVSGEAEADFDKGYRVNLDGTRSLFEAIRHEGTEDALHSRASSSPRPSPSSAQPFPEKIGDEFFTTPLTSYGTQKAICELLLADYSRRGIFDGIGIRLPTICIRPGKPEQGGFRLLLQHSARAAGRSGGRAAGGRERPPLVCKPALGGRLLRPRRAHGYRT